MSQTYRRLRDNYEKAKRYSEAGDFLIGEMEVTRKYRTNQAGKNTKRSWADPMKILFSLYYWLGKYGESIARPLAWTMITIILATHFLSLSRKPETLSEILLKHYPQALKEVLAAFLPFTRIGIGYHQLLLRSIGTIMLGLIFIALRRKLERR